MALVVVLLEAAQVFAAPATLSRDVGDYFALSFRRMRLKDFYVEAPGCNLGVNCQETGRTCGRLKNNGAVVNEPGQIAGDNLCGPGQFYEVFRNNTDGTCAPNCSMIQDPGPGPQCENTFTLPIVGDLDNDGNPSCGPNCDIDIGDVAAACGVPYPLPSCNPAKEVRVFAKQDCSPLEYDAVPGNGRCDLKPDPGGYGYIRVRNKGRINFPTGTTVACMLAVGKATRVTSDGPALVIIPGSGKASFNNLADVGGECREFKVVTEYGPVRFAKHGEFHLDACTLAGTMKLGHDNNLRGRFISGEFLVSNFNSTGACCEPTTTTTSTSSTTTVTTASTTTSTTIPNPQAVCCEDTNQVPPLCGSAMSAEECVAAGGVPGDVDTICQADVAGGGRCTTEGGGGGGGDSGCCQFAEACAIGGDLDDVRCTSLGGAFVSDAVCDPSGSCLPVTTTTITTVTSTTVTTVTSTTNTTVPTVTSTTNTTVPTTIIPTTSTSTTATSVTVTTSPSTTATTAPTTTTSTTIPGTGVCCAYSGEISSCSSAASEEACINAGGTPGQPGEECYASSGGGICDVNPPPPTGGCCELGDQCVIGDVDAVACSSLGGAFVEDAACLTDGHCVPVTTTTTTTPTTSTTTSTIPGTGVCCGFPGEVSSCSSAASNDACLNMGGTPGQPGSICHASAAGGVCDDQPPPPGGCCELGDQCAIGDFDATQCTSAGGVFVENAACLTDGHCVSVTTTTTLSSTSTSVTVTSSTNTSVTVTSSTNTSITVTTTPSSSTSTSSTTLPGQGFTRTLGFYKTHPGVTQWILDEAGGITVCGISITNTNVDDAHSALEALCVSPKGDQRIQLVRQLTAAALTMAAGGATFADFDECNTLCATGTGSIYDVGDCINSADAFNNSGDNLPAPFDGVESGYPEYCDMAHNTACTVLEPDTCSQ